MEEEIEESEEAEQPETVEADEDEESEEKPEPENEPLFTEEELRILNKSSGNSGLIGGVVSRGESSSTGNSTFSPENIETNTDDENNDENKEEDEDEAELPYVDGQSRGYAILNLMQPNARQSVRMQLSTMYHARIKHMFLAVLIDGTFSWDLPWFSSVIREFKH